MELTFFEDGADVYCNVEEIEERETEAKSGTSRCDQHNEVEPSWSRSNCALSTHTPAFRAATDAIRDNWRRPLGKCEDCLEAPFPEIDVKSTEQLTAFG